MTKFIKYFSIMICVFVLVGCGNEEKEKNKELPTDIANNIKLDTKGSSAVCTAEYDYSDTDGFVTGSKMVIYADENGIVTKIVTQEKVFSYDESILETIEAGANAITYTPPTNGQLFKHKMHEYREIENRKYNKVF